MRDSREHGDERRNSSDWDERNRRFWGLQLPQLDHRLHELPLFSRESLGGLIEAYPRERYNLTSIGEHGDTRQWLEGDRAGLNGNDVLRSRALLVEPA